MLKYFILSILILSSFAFGKNQPTADTGLDESEQNLEKIIIYPFTSSLISDYDAEYINRVAAKIVARQEKYFLVISKEIDGQTKLMRINSLSIEVFEHSGGALRLEAKIWDNNRKVIVKRVIREDFQKEDFKSVAEGALLVLFGFEEEYAAGVKDKKNIKENDFKEVQAKPDKNSIDFKKRILDLKKGLKQEFKIAEAKRKNENLEEEAEVKKEEEKDKALEKPITSSFKQLSNVYEPRGPQKIPGVHTFFTWYALGLSASNYVVQDRAGTDIEVQIRTKLNSLLANVYSEIWPPYFEQYAYFFRVGAAIPFYNTDEISPQAAPELDLGFLGAYFSEALYVRFGVRRDRQAFANLPELGGGVQLAEVDVTWALMSIHFLFWDRRLYLKYELASQLTSDFEDEAFTDGSLQISKSTARFGFSSNFLAHGSYLEVASQATQFKATGSRDITGGDTSLFFLWQVTF